MSGFFRKRRVYLDYASATPPLRDALRAIESAERHFANPGAIHADGLRAKHVLEGAREAIAQELACKARQVVFTSDLTEANNLAVLGFARKLDFVSELKGTHWIVSSIEHDSVLECFAEVERLGGIVSHAEPDQRGTIVPEEIERLLRPNTVFVSVGWANNEIGTIQPLRAISRMLCAQETSKRKVVLHSDAGQGPLYLSPHVHTLGVDLFALGAGKLYGPRSAGLLYVGTRDILAPHIVGGAQEGGLRAGTEEPAGAAGFAEAFRIISKERKMESARLKKLRDMLARELAERIPDLVVNGLPAPGMLRRAGDTRHLLPHMLNVSIPDISSEYITLALDHEGISLSTKSACREGEESASHVVAALGGEEWRAENTLRFSLGRDTRSRDVRTVAEALAAAVYRYRDFCKKEPRVI